MDVKQAETFTALSQCTVLMAQTMCPFKQIKETRGKKNKTVG